MTWLHSGLLAPFVACALFACTLLAPTATAQPVCSPVPGTGCPGANAVMCSGEARLGRDLTFQCLNNGRTPVRQLILGAQVPPSGKSTF